MTVRSTASQLYFLRTILILSIRLCLGLLSDAFARYFLTNTLYACLVSPSLLQYHAFEYIIGLTDVTILDERTVYSTDPALLSVFPLPLKKESIFLLCLYCMLHRVLFCCIYYVGVVVCL